MEMPVNDKDLESDESQDTALTSIHRTYTLAATNEPVTSEVDRVTVRYFMETLAEIALSVASRKVSRQE
jgi:hypothetical protein